MPFVEELLSWLERSRTPALYRRLNGTAVRALQQARLQNEPDDVGWLATNADLLAERLAQHGKVSASTAATYASRVRNVGKQYLRASSGARVVGDGDARAQHDRLAQLLGRVPPPSSAAQEIAEATMVIGRWPSLVPELVPALARAMRRLGVSKETEKDGP